MPSRKESFQQYIEPVASTMLSGQDVTSTIKLHGASLSGVQTPTGLDGSTITFLGSVDGANYHPIHNPQDNSPVAITTDGNATCYPLNPHLFYPWRYIKLQLDAPQTADREFQLSFYVF